MKNIDVYILINALIFIAFILMLIFQIRNLFLFLIVMTDITGLTMIALILLKFAFIIDNLDGLKNKRHNQCLITDFYETDIGYDNRRRFIASGIKNN